MLMSDAGLKKAQKGCVTSGNAESNAEELLGTVSPAMEVSRTTS